MKDLDGHIGLREDSFNFSITKDSWNYSILPFKKEKKKDGCNFMKEQILRMFKEAHWAPIGVGLF